MALTFISLWYTSKQYPNDDVCLRTYLLGALDRVLASKVHEDQPFCTW
jgi:hypothetical protein